jgi:hypothetical protein
MKKVNLQNRFLYTVGYSYDGVGFEFIRVGGYRGNYLSIQLKALGIFRNKYPARDIKPSDMKIGF